MIRDDIKAATIASMKAHDSARTATLRFVQPTTISYLVEATASFVDSALPNTPGAKPSITIRGEMLRARIE